MVIVQEGLCLPVVSHQTFLSQPPAANEGDQASRLSPHGGTQASWRNRPICLFSVAQGLAKCLAHAWAMQVLRYLFN